ncbi:MAG: NADH-quinone oxidoreductase subunit N, partial [Deltaproteobacteria bacterium]|nr:NADH-quinone oxidoreductase subunit N [Deltaproteobacteria bacterium]
MMPPIVAPVINLKVILPELVMVITALVVLLFDLVLSKDKKSLLGYLSLLGLAISLIVSIGMWKEGISTYAFNMMIVVDRFTLLFNALFIVATLITILISINYIREEGINYGEYYTLILIAAVGMMLMAKANDLIIVFLGLETLSISIYVLVGFLRTNLKSNEASLKYFLLGAFSSAFLLYGMAFVYGATGSTKLPEIAKQVPYILSNPLLLAAVGFLIVGFGFKVALVPFHMWTPDVYEGAPTSITAFMSVGVKAAAFSAFLRVFLSSFLPLRPDWTMILWILAVLTMTLGNVIALSQDNIKRMLAYSSIAHAGYILVAMTAGGDMATASIIYYLMAYTIMNLGAFAIVIIYGKKGEENILISDYAGSGFKYPFLSVAMVIFMFSLAGIPPLAGFIGKF